jgi:threonylcarbamoyladenosine tRNA methylthiotransferase MtaB
MNLSQKYGIGASWLAALLSFRQVYHGNQITNSRSLLTVTSNDANLPSVKVYLSTLGCKLNESESEEWARRFAKDGHLVVGNPREADLIVLNTCTVTHVAARKSRQLARQLARANPSARLLVAGCYGDVALDEARELPNVIQVVPNAEKDNLVGLAENLCSTACCHLTQTTNCARENETVDLATADNVVSSDKYATAEMQAMPPSSRTRAFVKMQDGCNMSCSYCIIPYARGKERSRPPEQVVEQVKSLIDAEYKEIVLTGVQISAYKHVAQGVKYSLRDVAKKILDETNVPRLRLTSIAPWDLDESLLDIFADDRLCRHLHLSLQSGCDAVLRRMRRPYSTEQFIRAVELARSRIPDVGITTDVIVGFPGESDNEFEESLRIVERIRFSRVHVFPYSPRDGTEAAALPMQVPYGVKDARAKRMQTVADASLHEFADRFVGRTLSVLWETRQEAEEKQPAAGEKAHVLNWMGYSDNYIRVFAAGGDDQRNQITSVRVRHVIGDGAIADIL